MIIAEIECGKCGATIEVLAGQGQVICQSCDALYWLRRCYEDIYPIPEEELTYEENLVTDEELQDENRRRMTELKHWWAETEEEFITRDKFGNKSKPTRSLVPPILTAILGCFFILLAFKNMSLIRGAAGAAMIGYAIYNYFSQKQKWFAYHRARRHYIKTSGEIVAEGIPGQQE